MNLREFNCNTFKYDKELMERKAGLFGTVYLPNLEVDRRGLETKAE